jgi:hypothetical protein
MLRGPAAHGFGILPNWRVTNPLPGVGHRCPARSSRTGKIVDLVNLKAAVGLQRFAAELSVWNGAEDHAVAV